MMVHVIYLEMGHDATSNNIIILYGITTFKYITVLHVIQFPIHHSQYIHHIHGNNLERSIH